MSTLLARRSSRKRHYGVKAGKSIDGCVAVFLVAGIACAFADAPANDTAKFVGVSTLPADNKDGANGEVKVEVEHEEIFFANAGDITEAHIGSKSYFSAINTLSISHNTNSRQVAGTITQVNDNGVWVLPEIA